MAFWDRSRDAIGQNRTWIVGRILVGFYVLFVVLPFLLLLGLLIAAVYAVLGGLYTLVFDRPLTVGRAWAYALFGHSVKLAKYPLGMHEYPGLIPSRADGMRSAM